MEPKRPAGQSSLKNPEAFTKQYVPSLQARLEAEGEGEAEGEEEAVREEEEEAIGEYEPAIITAPAAGPLSLVQSAPGEHFPLHVEFDNPSLSPK